jgi:hypothetical protein
MHRLALLVMLSTGLVAGLGPAVEAAAPCRQECPVEAPAGGCALDFCCSCCIHFRVDPPGPPRSLPEAVASGWLGVADARRLPLPDPREIAHVPKPARS